MQIEKHLSNTKEALEQAWQELQDTPSYVSRFREGRSSIEAEAHQFTQMFCSLCGFWVDEQHQCPPPRGA